MDLRPPDTLQDRVRRRIAELGVKPTAVAAQAGLGRDFILDILSGRKRSVRGDKLYLLAHALRCDAKWLLGGYEPSSRELRIAGDVLVNDVAQRRDEQPGLAETYTISEDEPVAEAWTLDKSSFGPFSVGWLVMNDHWVDRVSDQHLTKLCLVELHDLIHVLKRVHPGGQSGCYHLLSQTEPPMLNQSVVAIARVVELRQR